MAAFRRQARTQEQKRRQILDRIGELPRLGLPRYHYEARDGTDIVLPFHPTLEDATRDALKVQAGQQLPGRWAVETVVAERTFDLGLFGNLATEETRRGRLESLLAVRVRETVTAHRLTPSQADKLRLAGRGDIKRFFDEAEARRRSFVAVRSDLDAGLKSLQGMEPLIVAFEIGPFGDESLFAKTLAGVRRRDFEPQPQSPLGPPETE